MADEGDEHAQEVEPALSRSQQLLLDFLREHEADAERSTAPECPLCGYSLRALTRPVCPECGQQLVLKVGVERLRLGWLFAAIAPGFFSGIAGCFLFVVVSLQYLLGGFYSPTLIVLDAFGLASGAVAIVLSKQYVRFLARPRGTQKVWALGIWGVHAAALVLLFLLGPLYV